MATSTSYFLQGDGSLTNTDSVEIVWVPFNPDADIKGK
jgi:hypothetical protein